jgi:hypothetical protein
MAKQFKVTQFSKQFNLYVKDLKTWPAYIPSLESLQQLNTNLMNEEGIREIKFTKMDYMSRVQWKFGQEGMLSPPKNSYKKVC